MPRMSQGVVVYCVFGVCTLCSGMGPTSSPSSTPVAGGLVQVNSPALLSQDYSEKPPADKTTLWAAVIAAVFSFIAAILSYIGAMHSARAPLDHEETRRRLEQIQEMKTALAGVWDKFDFSKSLLSVLTTGPSHEDIVQIAVGWSECRSETRRLLSQYRIYMSRSVIRRIDKIEAKYPDRLTEFVVEQSTQNIRDGKKPLDIDLGVDQLVQRVQDNLKLNEYITEIDSTVNAQMDRLTKKLRWK